MEDYLEWFTWVFESGSAAQCRLFCVSLWAIWSDRNKRIMARVIKSAQEVAAFVLQYI